MTGGGHSRRYASTHRCHLCQAKMHNQWAIYVSSNSHLHADDTQHCCSQLHTRTNTRTVAVFARRVAVLGQVVGGLEALLLQLADGVHVQAEPVVNDAAARLRRTKTTRVRLQRTYTSWSRQSDTQRMLPVQLKIVSAMISFFLGNELKHLCVLVKLAYICFRCYDDAIVCPFSDKIEVLPVNVVCLTWESSTDCFLACS